LLQKVHEFKQEAERKTQEAQEFKQEAQEFKQEAERKIRILLNEQQKQRNAKGLVS
jgi:hypothetical protein